MNILYLLLILLLNGCGYTLRSNVINEYKSIYVPVFKNRIKIEAPSPHYQIYYPGLEIELTKAVIDRFSYDGNLEPVSKSQDADLILSATIEHYDRQALRYASAQEITEFRLLLEVEVSLYQASTNKEIFRENIIGDTTYFTTGPNAKSEAEAIDSLVKDVARRIVDRVVEGW